MKSAVLAILSPLALAAAILGPSPAAAQTEAETREAKVQVATGMDHYRAGEYRDAVQSFRRAFEVLPDAGSGLTWNIARSYEELGDITNAAHYFEVFLDRYPDDRSAGEAMRKLAALKPRRPGALTVKCGDARAATVTVGEDREGACGVKISNLTPGAHPVRVRWGERTWQGEATVEAAGTVQLVVDWSEATFEAAPPDSPAVPEETSKPKSETQPAQTGWTTKEWLVTGGVIAGALIVGAGLAYAIEQPGRVEVPSTELGERTVLQK